MGNLWVVGAKSISILPSAPAGGGEGRRGKGTVNCKAKMEAVEEEEGGSTVGGRSEFETGKPVRAYGKEGEKDISIRSILYLDLERSTSEKLYTFSI